MPELAGKVALVTGGSRGIGRAVAARLATDGAKAVITARDEARVRETAEELSAGGGQVEALPMDVSDRAAVEAGSKSCSSGRSNFTSW